MTDAYDLIGVNSPRMAGAALQVLASLLGKPLPRMLLAGYLIKSAGVNKLRMLELDDLPTYYPIHAHSNGTGAGEQPPAQALPFVNPGFIPETILDFVQGYRSGSFTPETIAERVLDAIERSDAGEQPLRAFNAVNREDFMRQARASTRRYAAGQPSSLLDGVPVAIKDELDMVPYGTTVGTRHLGKTPAQQDATVVARLRASGAIFPGKTNMHEVGIGITGLNIEHGTTRNPFHLDYHTGGSSSGTAAAVSAGITPAGMGADAGGSIRVPSSHCGVVGLKATFGRVSEAGAAPLCWSMGHVGPIAATAADLALIYSITAGRDARDPNSSWQPPVQAADLEGFSLAGLKLGVYPAWFEHAQPDIVTECRKLLAAFEQRGAEIIEITIPELDAARVAHLVIFVSEVFTNLVQHGFEHLAPETRAILSIANEFTPRDYTVAQQVRTRLMQSFQRAFEQVDMIITPTTAITASRIHADSLKTGEYNVEVVTETMRFVFASNLTGLPAITFPAGYDSLGLPVGMQVIGKAWEEHRLLSLAHLAGEIVPRQKPRSSYSILPVQKSLA